VADGDIFERAGGDVAVKCLDRDPKLGSGLRCSFEPVRRGLARLARPHDVALDTVLAMLVESHNFDEISPAAVM